MPERNRRLSLLISDHEHEMIHALAEKEGISASDVTRQLIRTAFLAAFGEKKPSRSTS